MGLISLSSSENCYYNKEVCQFDEEQSSTGLTTLEMTSYSALAKMILTDDIWEKLPNDTANGVAYYPSFKGKGVGKITVKYYDENGKEVTPVNAGRYTIKIDTSEGDNYMAASGLTADSWKFMIEKAGAETLPDTEVSYRWSTDKDITVSVAGLPENMGKVTVDGTKKDGTIIAGIIPGSCYSDGKLTFHLGPNTADDIGKTGSFTVTLAADNYESVTFAVKITLTAKDNQEAPNPAAFDVVFTNDGSELTATIKTKLKGVEYSFDGKTWSNVNTTAAAHLKDVTAYLRYKETDELNASATISLNGETTVPAEVIKAIADRKIRVEFVYDSTKSWLVDGAEITAVSAVDLSLLPGSVDTSSLRGISGGKYRISADIPAEIRFTFRKQYAGEFANVYKLIDGKLVFQTCVKLAEDGTAVIPGMNAPGEYVVMVCRYSDRQGDFDNNGVLDIYDAVALLRYSVGIDSGEDFQLIDLNGDGQVNCADASIVLRWLVGLSA